MGHPVLRINLDGDGAWPDLKDATPERVFRTEVASLAALEGGMKGGRPSVMLRIDCPDGRVVLYETSVSQFLMAAAALRGRFGEG